MTDIFFYDAHLHLQKMAPPQIREVLLAAKENQVKYLLCNATSEQDWPNVANLSKLHKNIIPFFGIHPWEKSIHNNWETKLIKYLTDYSAGLGEIGLDKNSLIPIKQQEETYLHQIILAKKLNLPTTLHIIHQWEKFFSLTKDYGLPTSCLLHAFYSSKEIAFKLIDLGLYLSLSTKFIFSQKALTTIKSLPLDRILIETDAPKEFLPQDIPYLVKHLATIKGKDYLETTYILQQNLKEFLSHIINLYPAI